MIKKPAAFSKTAVFGKKQTVLQTTQNLYRTRVWDLSSAKVNRSVALTQFFLVAKGWQQSWHIPVSGQLRKGVLL
jgi:hypothetical protein